MKAKEEKINYFNMKNVNESVKLLTKNLNEKRKILVYFERVVVDKNQQPPKMVMEAKFKIVPENIRNIIFDKLKKYKGDLKKDKLEKLFKCKVDDWEDFDRMKHMTQEQRDISDKMKLINEM